MHVVDLSHPQFEDHINTVNETLISLGVEDKPQIMVFNKVDAYREKNFDKLLEQEVKDQILSELKENLSNQYRHPVIFVSALKKENINDCLLYTSPSPRDATLSRMPSSA